MITMGSQFVITAGAQPAVSVSICNSLKAEKNKREQKKARGRRHHLFFMVLPVINWFHTLRVIELKNTLSDDRTSLNNKKPSVSLKDQKKNDPY